MKKTLLQNNIIKKYKILFFFFLGLQIDETEIKMHILSRITCLTEIFQGVKQLKHILLPKISIAH